VIDQGYGCSRGPTWTAALARSGLGPTNIMNLIPPMPVSLSRVSFNTSLAVVPCLKLLDSHSHHSYRLLLIYSEKCKRSQAI